MDEYQTETVPVRVRFGPGNDQDMPLSWAENMLMDLKEKQPKRFGDLLAAAAMNGHTGLK